MLYPDKTTCIIEMTPPRRDAQNMNAALQRFSERFTRVMTSGFVASVSDNVMGVPHVQPLEIIQSLKLTPFRDQVIVHLNTFHTGEEVDRTLQICQNMGITNLLCLTGDGSELLPKLQPEEINAAETQEVTSVELIRYIKTSCPNFSCGTAFNPYVPLEKELKKMERKLAAGADFVITQPVLGKNENLDRLMERYPDLPVVVECWFSKNLDLLSDLIGEKPKDGDAYDGFETLLELRKAYPNSGNCMSMINFKTAYSQVEQYWNEKRHSRV